MVNDTFGATNGRVATRVGEASQALALDGLDAARYPYHDSREHLADELRRVDQFVRAQTVRWRLTLGAAKPEALWGMIHVTDAEVDAYLSAPFGLGDVPDALAHALRPYWDAASALERDIQARQSATSPDVVLRLARLQALFGLSALDRDAVLVCLLSELDGRYRRLFGYLQDDATRTRPSVELVLQTLHPLVHPASGYALFAADAPLIRRRLLIVDSEASGDVPLAMRSLRLDDRIAAYLLGSDTLDARLSALLAPAPPGPDWDDLVADAERRAAFQQLAAWWQTRRGQPDAGGVAFLHGPYGSGRLTTARAICAAADTPLLLADVGQALHSPLGWEASVDLCYREALLQNAALYWAGCEALLAPEQPPQRWDALVTAAQQFVGLTFLASHTAWEPAGVFRSLPFFRLDFGMPGYDLRCRLWTALLPPAPAFAEPAPDRAVLAELLANSFQLTEGQMADAVATARGLAFRRDPAAPRLTVDDLHEGCRRQSGLRLMTFARRVEPRTDLTFDDLILPPPNRRQLQELRDRIRLRSRVYSGLGFERRLSLGKGLIALFTGASGTGKTMAAELLAREQRVDLYKVDLSAVVSKYVGETEKNLSRIFAEAEDANAIIFFDEADALFGKRGEVKEARDRWANIEINFLLQRIEEYAGVVILASNLRQNIDEAFLRRLHVIVDFPFPDAAARLRIWQGMFPPGVAVPPAADLQPLADRFRLAGGSIKNIVVDAAFRALAEAGGGPPTLTLRHLVDATAREYHKLGKPITKGEFGDQFYAWVESDLR